MHVSSGPDGTLLRMMHLRRRLVLVVVCMIRFLAEKSVNPAGNEPAGKVQRVVSRADMPHNANAGGWTVSAPESAARNTNPGARPQKDRDCCS